METRDTEREILQKALQGLQKVTNLNAQVEYGNFDFDAVIRIGLHEMEWDFPAEVRNRVTPATLGVFTQKTRLLSLSVGFSPKKTAFVGRQPCAMRKNRFSPDSRP